MSIKNKIKGWILIVVELLKGNNFLKSNCSKATLKDSDFSGASLCGSKLND